MIVSASSAAHTDGAMPVWSASSTVRRPMEPLR
jgi:hypothetical protein